MTGFGAFYFHPFFFLFFSWFANLLIFLLYNYSIYMIFAFDPHLCCLSDIGIMYIRCRGKNRKDSSLWIKIKSMRFQLYCPPISWKLFFFFFFFLFWRFFFFFPNFFVSVFELSRLFIFNNAIRHTGS